MSINIYIYTPIYNIYVLTFLIGILHIICFSVRFIHSYIPLISMNTFVYTHTHTRHTCFFFRPCLYHPWKVTGMSTHISKNTNEWYIVYIYDSTHHPISNPTPISISYCWKGFNSANHCICKQKAHQWEKPPTSSAYIPAGEQFL